MSWFPRRLLNAFHAMFHLQGQRLPSLSRAAAAASSRRIAEKKSWLSSTSVSHNSAQAHLRLTVAGESPFDTPQVVRSLVQIPTKEETLLNGTGRASLQYGEVLDDTVPGQHIAIPSPWLKTRPFLQVLSLSGIQPLDSDAEKTIEQSAITVLVTDSIRLLSTPTSKFLVSLILDKPAAGLLVRLLPNDIVPKDFAKSQLKKQLDGLGATQLPVFYTHSVSDREALQPLVSHIESLLSSPESLKALEQTAKIHALQRASKARSESLLESRNALQSSLESLQRIEKETIERLVMLKEEFQSKDSAILQASCASVSDSLRESLGSLSVPKLWFKGDSVADEVASVLQNDALLDEGRSQMAFAMGKLVQAQKDLFDRLQEHLSELSTVSVDLGPFLQQTQQALKARPESPALDPIVLADLIVPFDASKAVLDLQTETDKLARNSLVMQAVWLGLCGIVTHLGVPFALALPSTAVTMGLSLGWYSLRWTSLKDRFIGQVSLAHKQMTKKISDHYEYQLQTHVAGPIEGWISLTEKAIILQANRLKAMSSQTVEGVEKKEESDKS